MYQTVGEKKAYARQKRPMGLGLRDPKPKVGLGFRV